MTTNHTTRRISAPRDAALRAASARPHPRSIGSHGSTAIVYCEANFGAIDGKTANGLVRHSERYEIVSVIDSTHAGQDAGVVLDDAKNEIPVCRDLADALSRSEAAPRFFILGIAPASGMLSSTERGLVIDAMSHGMNIVSGLHEFLSDDPELEAASTTYGVEILDVRKPRSANLLRTFTGAIDDVGCPRIAVLGTDCAIGKRTTATILTRALKERGIRATLVCTGQTGLIQGALHGVALDAVPSQFCAGELEAAIVDAYTLDRPDVLIVEGQGALSHPAYSTSSFILRGSKPHAVILQHAPGRARRCDFDGMAMPNPEAEIRMIETFSDTRVIGLTINHENMSEDEVALAITRYTVELGIPATDALWRPSGGLADMVVAAFPALAENDSPVSG